MGISWPRPGIPIVPYHLRSVWREERIPVAFLARAGLPIGTTVGDLDAEIWEIASSNEVMAPVCRYVANLVSSRLYYRGQSKLVDQRILPGRFEKDVVLKEIPYSPRTKNILIASRRLEDRLWLEQVTYGVFLSLRNAGPRTLLDFAAVAEGFVDFAQDSLANDMFSLATTQLHSTGGMPEEYQRLARDYPINQLLSADPRLAHLNLGRSTVDDDLRKVMLTGFQDRHGIKRLIQEVRLALKLIEDQPLDEALIEIINGLGFQTKYKRALPMRLGWDGQAGTTLQIAAEVAGVTRERIRQVQQQVFKSCKRYAYLPALDRAIDFLNTSASRLDLVSNDSLQDAGITSGLFHPKGVLTAAEAFGRDIAFSISADGRFVENKDTKALKPLRTVVANLTDVNHVAPLEEIQARCAEQYGWKPSIDTVRNFLSSQERVVWLTSDGKWIWDGKDCRYINYARKILSVSREVSLEKLREGVLRHHRTRNMSLPREVFRGLCRAAGFQVCGDLVSLAEGHPVSSLGSSEQRLVDALIDAGGVATAQELRDRCLRRGLNRHSFWTYLVYCPLIERLATGVYCLRGATLDPAKVAVACDSEPSGSTSIMDHGWTKDGAIWIGFRVGHSLLDQGQVYLPVSVKNVLGERRTELYSIDGHMMGTLVISETGNAWGLSPFITRRGVEMGDVLVVSLDTELEVACVVNGSDELLMSYQDGNGWGPRRYLEEATRPTLDD